MRQEYYLDTRNMTIEEEIAQIQADGFRRKVDGIDEGLFPKEAEKMEADPEYDKVIREDFYNFEWFRPLPQNFFTKLFNKDKYEFYYVRRLDPVDLACKRLGIK